MRRRSKKSQTFSCFLRPIFSIVLPNLLTELFFPIGRVSRHSLRKEPKPPDADGQTSEHDCRDDSNLRGQTPSRVQSHIFLIEPLILCRMPPAQLRFSSAEGLSLTLSIISRCTNAATKLQIETPTSAMIPTIVRIAIRANSS